MKPLVTVVICSFNRYDLLGKAITSIELQDFPEDRYELVIVDNSDDLAGRERFLDGLEIACNHRYFIEGRPGLSRARNVGVAAADGDHGGSAVSYTKSSEMLHCPPGRGAPISVTRT